LKEKKSKKKATGETCGFLSGKCLRARLPGLGQWDTASQEFGGQLHGVDITGFFRGASKINL
jgi:hypothetical protein